MNGSNFFKDLFGTLYRAIIPLSKTEKVPAVESWPIYLEPSDDHTEYPKDFMSNREADNFEYIEEVGDEGDFGLLISNFSVGTLNFPNIVLAFSQEERMAGREVLEPKLIATGDMPPVAVLPWDFYPTKAYFACNPSKVEEMVEKLGYTPLDPSNNPETYFVLVDEKSPKGQRIITIPLRQLNQMHTHSAMQALPQILKEEDKGSGYDIEEFGLTFGFARDIVDHINKDPALNFKTELKIHSTPEDSYHFIQVA